MWCLKNALKTHRCCCAWKCIQALSKCNEQILLLPSGLEPHVREFRVRCVIIELRRAAYWFQSSCRIYVVLVADSIALLLHYLLLYRGNVRIVALLALALWRHSYFPRFGSIAANAKCNEQKLLLPNGLDPRTSDKEVPSQALCPLSHCRAAYVVLSIYVVLTAHYR